MTVVSPEPRPSFARRRFLSAGLTGIIIVGIVAIYVQKVANRMPDYEVYRRAAERALVAAPLYRPDDGHWQFKYLPAFAVVMLPLGLAPDRVVRACWFAGSILILVLVLRKSVRVLPERLHSRAYLIGITVLALGKFYAHELELGQVNIHMLALVVLALAEMQAGREVAAGLLVAAAIVLKPYAVLLLPWLVARRRLPSIAGAAIGTTVRCCCRYRSMASRTTRICSQTGGERSRTRRHRTLGISTTCRQLRCSPDGWARAPPRRRSRRHSS